MGYIIWDGNFLQQNFFGGSKMMNIILAIAEYNIVKWDWY